MISKIVLLVGKFNAYEMLFRTEFTQLHIYGILIHKKKQPSVNHMNYLCNKMLFVDTGIYKLQGKFLSFPVIRAENLITTCSNIKRCIPAALAPFEHK